MNGNADAPKEQITGKAIGEAIEEELKKVTPDWRKIEALSRTIVDADPDSVRFSVDAGHVQRLGEQLVSKQETALSELIKNAYDADASTVTLTFTGQDKAGGTLTIEDDGIGMTEEIIRTNWMRISTINKLAEPVSQVYKRKRAGSKGIGRFSVQRLGRRLMLTSRPANETLGYRVYFNWDEEFRPGADLNNIFSKIERFAKSPLDHGTKLTIGDLRDPWPMGMIGRVWKAVLLLQSPDLAVRSHLPSQQPINRSHPQTSSLPDPGFQVEINGQKQGAQLQMFSLQKSFLDGALATISAKIGPDGTGYVSVKSAKLKIDDFGQSSESYDLVGPANLNASYFIYEAGTISGMTQAAAARIGREHGGIRIYRNGFRVPPYGEPNDDWLHLAADTARRNLLMPASNQNFFGKVELTTEGNPLIEETSSREGLVENEAFKQLTSFSRWALEWAAARIGSVRKRKTTAGQRYFTSQVRRPSEILNDLADKIAIPSQGHGNNRPWVTNTPKTLQSELKSVVNLIQRFEQEVDEQRNAALEYEEMLRILASLGLSISVFGHEVKGAQTALEGNVALLGELIAEVEDRSLNDLLTEQHEDLRRAADRMFDIGGYIAGLMSNTESRELRDLSVLGAVDRFVRQFSSYMAKQSVTFEVDIVPKNMRTTPMHATELDSVLLNFLTNSIKSMKRSKVHPRRVRIEAREADGFITIAFEDNGEGIPEADRDRVFDPFFTTTLSAAEDDGIAGPGTGLGLKIVSDIAQSYGGEARVGQASPGFSCRIEFVVLAQNDARDNSNA